MPRSGAPYEETDLAGVRRLLLGRIGFHVYYTIDEGAQRVIVRAVWHAARGQGPELA